MQALSFAVHIPLVCFGIAFPALVCSPSGSAPAHRRPGLPHARPALVEGDARAVRRRRRHGHDPQLRARAALAGLHGEVRRRVRPRLHARGLLVLPRGDLHRHLRLRLGPPVAPRAPAGRHPDRDRRRHGLADRDRGQRLDEPPDRLHARRTARVVDVHPWSALFGNSYFWHEFVHMYFAGYIVAGFLVAGVYAWALLRGRRGRYERTALAIPLAAAALAAPLQIVVGDWAGRDVAGTSRSSWRPSRGSAQTTRARPSTSAAGTRDGQSGTGSRSPICSRCSPTTTRARPSGLDTVPAPTGRRSTSSASRSRRWSGSARCSRCSACVPRCRGCAGGGCPSRAWFYRALVAAGAAVGRRADRRLGHDRGRPPALDRLQRDAHAEAVTGAGGIPVGYGALVWSTSCLPSPSSGCCAASPARRSSATTLRLRLRRCRWLRSRSS